MEHFTFTIVAYTAAITGGISFSLLIFFDIEKKKKNLVIGIIAIAFSSMIRPAVCEAILVILGICSLLALFKYKKKIGLWLCFLVGVIMTFFVISNESLVCQSNVERDFYEWSSIRVQALDSKQVSWEENQEVFEKKGMSKDIYDIIYSARYVDKEIVSVENLQLLAELNSTEKKYNYNIKDYFYNYFSFITDLSQIHNLYKLLFWIIFIFSLLYIRKIDIWVVGITPICVESIFIFINRMPYRVVMPVYIFGTILLLIVCEKMCQTEERKKNIYKVFVSVGLIGVVSLLVFESCNYWEKYNYDWKENCIETLSYMEENQDKLFLPISSDLYALEIYRPVFEFAGQNGRCFLCGNGDAFSEPYYSAMEYYDIQNPDRVILETVDNEGVLFLGTSNEDNANELYQSILNYVYSETGKKVVLEKKEDVTTYLSVYKMISVD